MFTLKIVPVIFLIVFHLQSIVWAQPELHTSVLKDFKLESGVVMPECRITYRLFGRLNEHKTNAVLYNTWFAGNSAHLGGLIGAGKIVDSAKYFVVAIDALGDGFSSSPSNTKPDSGQTFPEITIHDMVTSQYRVLTEVLKLNHLHAVIGGSMGSMQTFEWLVSYPEYFNKAVPYVCTPKLTSFDLLWMNWAKGFIINGRECNRSDKAIWRDLNTLTAAFGRTPEHIVSAVATDTFYNYYNTFFRDPSPTFTLDNYFCQLKAMINHDIYRRFNGSVEVGASHIKAQVFMILSEEDHLIRPENAIALSKILKCKIEIINNKMGHMSVGKELPRVSKLIDSFLNE